MRRHRYANEETLQIQLLHAMQNMQQRASMNMQNDLTKQDKIYVYSIKKTKTYMYETAVVSQMHTY